MGLFETITSPIRAVASAGGPVGGIVSGMASLVGLGGGGGGPDIDIGSAGSWIQHAAENTLEWTATEAGTVIGKGTGAVADGLGINKIIVLLGIGIAASIVVPIMMKK